MLQKTGQGLKFLRKHSRLGTRKVLRDGVVQSLHKTNTSGELTYVHGVTYFAGAVIARVSSENVCEVLIACKDMKNMALHK